MSQLDGARERGGGRHLLHPGSQLPRRQIIADPTGHLARLRAALAPRFDHPAAVQVRCADAIAKLEARLAGIDPNAAWHDQVTSWMLPTSITTHVVLVAARQNPTVRLRYLAARTVLRRHGEDALYLSLLRLLGCADRDGRTVQHHLDRLAVTFDQAAALARTPLPFSSGRHHPRHASHRHRRQPGPRRRRRPPRGGPLDRRHLRALPGDLRRGRALESAPRG